MGCGFDDNNKMAKVLTHGGSYFKNPDTSLVAFCDIDVSKLKKYGKKYNVNNLFKSSREMFANIDLDLISICTLADTHLELVKQASRSGVKGIFLEKPISSNLKDAKKIIGICNSQNIQLSIDHQRRFDPFFHQIKKILNQNKIGKIQLVTVFYGAGIANTGTHVFDLLRFLFGDAKTVRGALSVNKSPNSADPNIDVELEFKNEIFVKLIALNVNNYGMLEMNIFGSIGRLVINLATNDVSFYKISQKNHLVYKQLEKSNIQLKKSKSSPIMLGLQDLVKCVKTGKSPMCSGRDGYKALELTIASLLSAKNKKMLSIPVKEQRFRIKSRLDIF